MAGRLKHASLPHVSVLSVCRQCTDKKQTTVTVYFSSRPSSLLLALPNLPYCYFNVCDSTSRPILQTIGAYCRPTIGAYIHDIGLL